ncbi:MAG TPA: GH116 family glycosyl hydrolase [Cytophagaceae bacterium]
MKRRDFFKSGALSALAVTSIHPAFAALPSLSKPLGIKSTTSQRVISESLKQGSSGLTLGGIGTGGIEIGHDGALYNWRIFNNFPKSSGAPIKFTQDDLLYFIIKYQEGQKPPALRMLKLQEEVLLNKITVLKGVEKVHFKATFPFATFKYHDADMPFEVELEASSFFIPNDLKNSALPAINFDFKIHSKSAKPVDISLVGCFRNTVGYDVIDKQYAAKLETIGGNHICTMACHGIDAKHTSYGSITLSSPATDTAYLLGWDNKQKFYDNLLREAVLPNLDLTPDRNAMDRNTGTLKAGEFAYSSLSVSKTLFSNESIEHNFLFTWNFPNQYNQGFQNIEGNYYSNYFSTSNAIAEYVIAHKESLYKQTKAFIDNFYDTSLEPYVSDQINSHLNTLVSNSWLNQRGDFGIQQGLSSDKAFGEISTVDVGMFTCPVISLFPQLQRNIMKAHERVMISGSDKTFKIGPDFAKLIKGNKKDVRLDLPMQYVIMVLRDFFWTNDKLFLEQRWPYITKALDYMLELDVNQDSLPEIPASEKAILETPMFGVSSYISTLWISALASAVEGAKVLNDYKAQVRYSVPLEKAKRVSEEKLWNGKYFRFYNDEANGKMNDGCFTNQLIGQWTNRMSGLGNIYSQEKTHSALKSIYEMSYKPHRGVLNCSWKEEHSIDKEHKDEWHKYSNNISSGTELGFASQLIYEGFYEEGLSVIKTVHDRYKATDKYFDHQLNGIGHQYLPLSSWTILNALLGLEINCQTYSFSPKLPGKYYKAFFAAPGFTAHFTKNYDLFTIKVLTGKMSFNTLIIPDIDLKNKPIRVTVENKATVPNIKYLNIGHPTIHINFKETLVLEDMQSLKINFN